MSSVTLHSLFTYNFIFGLHEMFIPAKTNLKRTSCVLNPLSQGTGVLCVVSLAGFLHSAKSNVATSCRENAVWHGIKTCILQLARRGKFCCSISGFKAFYLFFLFYLKLEQLKHKQWKALFSEQHNGYCRSLSVPLSILGVGIGNPGTQSGQ